MADLRQRTLVSVQVNLDTFSTYTSVFARSHRAEFGNPSSFDIAEPLTTIAQPLLGSVVNNVLVLISSIAKRLSAIVGNAIFGAAITAAEATAKVDLAESTKGIEV